MPEKSTKKRKREVKSATEDEAPEIDAMEVLRRHFESQYAPLKETGVKKKAKKKAKVEEVDDEWEGISEDDTKVEEERFPEVVEFNTSIDPLETHIKLPKSILKSFMSSKPPTLLSSTTPDTKTKHGKSTTADKDKDEDEDPTTEASLLKNDLALQRLLRESHLLDASSGTLEATGKNRLKALESRVQALGGKDITKQRHPMLIRRAMDAGKKMKEEKRRRLAKESGIVLEKVVRVKKVSEREKTRSRGFGPSVGRFRNGTLVLSKRDVMDIEGRTGASAKGGKGKGFKSGKGKGGKKRR